MAASNDIPWLGLRAADRRRAGAPDAGLLGCHRDGDAGRAARCRPLALPPDCLISCAGIIASQGCSSWKGP